MIDVLNETLISLQEAAAICPRRQGKQVHISSVYRWTTAGCRGVILESVQVGGTRCTSREALSRFFQRLTRQSQPTLKGGTTAGTSPSSANVKEVEPPLDGKDDPHPDCNVTPAPESRRDGRGKDPTL